MPPIITEKKNECISCGTKWIGNPTHPCPECGSIQVNSAYYVNGELDDGDYVLLDGQFENVCPACERSMILPEGCVLPEKCPNCMAPIQVML